MTWHVKQWRLVLGVVVLFHAMSGCLEDMEGGAPEAVEQEEAVSAEVSAQHVLSCEDIRPEELGLSRSVILRANAPEAACGPGEGNGAGVLALRNDGPFGVVAWSLVSAEGVPFGRLLVGGDFGSTLLPHRRGFHLRIDSFPSSTRLQAYTSEGEFLRQTSFGPEPIESLDVAVDPQGGTVAVWWSPAGDNPTTRNLMFQAFDERGRPRTSPRIVQTVGASEALSLFVGVDLRGRVLVLWQRSDSTWMGQWLSRDGRARTQPFAVPVALSPSSGDRLQPLVREGLVLRLGGQWVRQFPSGEPTSLPAPDWLAANPGTDLALIRNNHAYALLPAPTLVEGSGCQERVSLFTRDGESCGDLIFPFGGSTCEGRRLGLGLDGTVIQQVELNIPANDQCAWRWWPRLLR